jgi:uncharacterized protein (DUF1778 family)
MAQVLRAEDAPPRHRGAKSTKPSASSKPINLRADEATRALIDSAARALGQNRTEFMLMSARAYAQEVMLRQVYFTLGDADWKALNTALAAPPPPNAALKRLMARTPSWQT